MKQPTNQPKRKGGKKRKKILHEYANAYKRNQEDAKDAVSVSGSVSVTSRKGNVSGSEPLSEKKDEKEEAKKVFGIK